MLKIFARGLTFFSLLPPIDSQGLLILTDSSTGKHFHAFSDGFITTPVPINKFADICTFADTCKDLLKSNTIDNKPMGTSSSIPESALHQEVSDASEDENREETPVDEESDVLSEEKEITKADQKQADRLRRYEQLASKQRKRGGTFILCLNEADATKNIRFELHPESAASLIGIQTHLRSCLAGQQPRVEKKAEIPVEAPVSNNIASSIEDDRLREDDEGSSSILVHTKKKEKKGKTISGATKASPIPASSLSSRVTWGSIEVREFKRTVGRGVVADHSDQTWLLGLSDTLIFNGSEHSPSIPGDDAKPHSDDAEAIEYEKFLADAASAAALASAAVKDKKNSGKARTASIAESTKQRSLSVAEHSDVVEESTNISASVTMEAAPFVRTRLLGRRTAIPGFSVRIGTVEEVEAKRVKDLAERYSRLSIAQKALILTPAAQAALAAAGGDFSRASANNISVALETRQSHNKTLRAAARIAASAASSQTSSSASSVSIDHKRNPFWDYLKPEERRLIFERDVGAGATSSNGELFSIASLSEHFASAAQAKRDAKGCDCNAKIEKEVKRHSNSLKELQSLAVKVGVDSLEEANSTKELTKKELGEKITAHLKHDRLCLSHSPPAFELSGSDTKSDEGLTSDEIDLKRLIESQDFAQAPPETSVSAKHVLMDARAGYMRARLLESEVNKDLRSFFIQRKTLGIENYGSVTTTSSSSIHQSSPMSTPLLTSQSSPTSSSSSSPPLAATFECPCALDGVGCHYARCNCSVGECNNLSFWHCTSARYDAEATEVFRAELIKYSKNRQMKLFLDAESDMASIWNSIDAHWVKEKEKAAKRGEKKAARAERRNEKEDEERLKKEREEQDRIEAEAAAALVEKIEKEQEELRAITRAKEEEAKRLKEIQQRKFEEEEARRKEAEELDRLRNESLQALQREMVKHQQRVALHQNKTKASPIGVEAVSMSTIEEQALVSHTQAATPPRQQHQHQRQRKVPAATPPSPSVTAPSPQQNDDHSSPAGSPPSSSIKKRRAANSSSPRGGGPATTDQPPPKVETSPLTVGQKVAPKAASPKVALSASVAAEMLAAKLAASAK